MLNSAGIQCDTMEDAKKPLMMVMEEKYRGTNWTTEERDGGREKRLGRDAATAAGTHKTGERDLGTQMTLPQIWLVAWQLCEVPVGSAAVAVWCVVTSGNRSF